MPSIYNVKEYWNNHPLFSYELPELGSEDFFLALDRIKRQDTERFAIDFWEFDKFKNKKVLDVGCGPGWLTVNYALNEAVVYAIDLTPAAVALTKKYLESRKIYADVRKGNAEDLQFKDNSFDLVVSSGVLHHTPDTCKAIRECFRVLKPGGKVKVTLYRKGILHNEIIFIFTKAIMRLLRIKHPGANLAKEAKDVDDFIRRYDGSHNPVGIGKKDKEWIRILRDVGFRVVSLERHFFPRRFIPFNLIITKQVHFVLDRYLGTMVYFNLIKPK